MKQKLEVDRLVRHVASDRLGVLLSIDSNNYAKVELLSGTLIEAKDSQFEPATVEFKLMEGEAK